METASIAIVGAGLSGLYAAYLLTTAGISDYVVLEARDVIGGRIAVAYPPDDATAPAASPAKNRDRFDLGPTWYWPAYQRRLDGVIGALGLDRFDQYETGDMVFESSPNQPPVRTRGYRSAPTSVRLAGGMAALVDGLYQRLDAARIRTGRAVTRLQCGGGKIVLTAEDRCGRAATYQAAHVLLAVPPRLAMTAMDFVPALPEALQRGWRDVPTWMAPHAKYLAIYAEPFWRGQGLSGEARSACGPLVEIHDASAPGGHAALFGFFGIPARTRQQVSGEVLRAHCRSQLARLFGPRARNPRADFIKDWAAEPYTASAADQEATDHIANAPLATAQSGVWQDRLVGIASEWSRQFPGYVAGAVQAAENGVATVLRPSGEVV